MGRFIRPFLLGYAMATAKKKPAAKRKTGRPTKYTKELADKICELLSEGKSERKICKMPGMPARRTLLSWKEDNPEFLRQSAQARAQGAEVYDEKRRENADYLLDLIKASALSGRDIPKGVVEGLKVVIQEDARSAANLDPNRFSDKQKIDVNSTVTQPQTVTIVNDLNE